MAFCSKTNRVLVLLQIALLLVVSALIMPRSVCHGARGVGTGAVGLEPLDPNRPACLGRCPLPGQPYTGGGYGHRPGGGGGPGSSYPAIPYPGGGGGPRSYPSNGETSRP